MSHNMSVSRLAIDSGINPSTIATAKSRGCQLNLDTIIRICDHLEMPLMDFFAELVSNEPTSVLPHKDSARHLTLKNTPIKVVSLIL